MSNKDWMAPEPTGGGFCNYEAGMGGEENVVGLSNEEVCCVIACHEAGHAAISYSLGLGCSAIVFDAKSNFQAYTRTSKAGALRILRARSGGRFTSDLLGLGVVAAAGTAAHRRLFTEIGHPNRNIGSADDREFIEWAANSMWQDPRSRFAPDAYRRLVWRLAQQAIADQRIWLAVLGITQALSREWLAEPGEPLVTGKMVHGAKLRAIMRREKVAPGMFGKRVREMSKESRLRRIVAFAMRPQVPPWQV